MVGRIDTEGTLNIVRGKKEVTMQCRPGGRTTSAGFANCSHRCPLFGEVQWRDNGNNANVTWLLPICEGRILEFSTLTDDRLPKRPPVTEGE